MRHEVLTKAKYSEWQASLFGASFFSPYAYIIILVGIILHGWGMYKTHLRNK